MMGAASQRFQRRTLQVLLAVSVGLLLWGIVRARMDGLTHHQALVLFHDLDSPLDILRATLRAEPVALLCAGIAVLVVSPFVRLILLTINFSIERDWMYVASGLFVGAVIVASFFIR